MLLTIHKMASSVQLYVQVSIDSSSHDVIVRIRMPSWGAQTLGYGEIKSPIRSVIRKCTFSIQDQARQMNP